MVRLARQCNMHRAAGTRQIGILVSAALVTTAAIVALPVGSDAARGAVGASDAAWSAPVAGPVVKAFEPPLVTWGRGHLGVDYGVPRGTAVRSAGAGTVAFAGQVGGALHVVVLHAGGLRTSYSFLAGVSVRRGHEVVRGEVLGTTGGAGPGHAAGVVHFGLRAGERYVDPLLLFRPVDLASLVHLVSLADGLAPVAPPGVEGEGVLAGLGHLVGGVGGAVVSSVADLLAAGAGGVEVLLEELDTLARALAPLADVLAAGAIRNQAVVDWLSDLSPVNLLPGLALDVGASLLAWAGTLDDCDPEAPPADGSGGSGHAAIVVAGINSSTGADGETTPLPVDLLGYAGDEVSYFSYAPDGGPYVGEDSYASIETSAALLAGQLREMQAEHPGRVVDVIAHSQGGVVALAFLELIYDPDDSSYPPLGPVVTFSSPYSGAPLATAEVLVAATPAGRALLDQVPGDLVPPPSAESVGDLAEGSALLGRLHEAALPPGIELTSIGAALDVVVPATSTGIPGAARFVVNPWSLSAHGAIVGDPEALRTARAALEGRPLPCEEFTDALVGAVAPELISRAEHAAVVLAAAATAGAQVAAGP